MQISSTDVGRFLNQREDDYPFSEITCNNIFQQMVQELFKFLERERDSKVGVPRSKKQELERLAEGLIGNGDYPNYGDMQNDK